MYTASAMADAQYSLYTMQYRLHFPLRTDSPKQQILILLIILTSGYYA